MPIKTKRKQDRVERVTRVIGSHFQVRGYDPDAAVRDLLADLRHYCDANGLDFAKEDKAAYASYLEELRGDQ